jgi:hypothetical protein
MPALSKTERQEIELLRGQYHARCRAATLPQVRDRRRCHADASVIVGYVDARGRPPKAGRGVRAARSV